MSSDCLARKKSVGAWLDRVGGCCRFRTGCGFLILALLAGCSQSHGRHSLQGTVTLDEKPLSGGYITFIPQPGTSGPTAGGEIRDGQYAVSAADGTFAGTFRVEIRATRKTGRKIKRPPLDEIVDEFEQYLPSRYNGQSELTVEVKDEGPGEFDFHLEST